MVITIENGHGVPGSNPGCNVSNRYEYIAGQTSLGKRKFSIQAC